MAARILQRFRTALRGSAVQPTFLKWDSEELFVTGEEFFNALESAIDGAVSEAWIETYILKDDQAGRRVLDAMIRAARRGVDTRLIIDGFGSQDWIRRRYQDYQKLVSIQIYRPLPFRRFWHSLQQLEISALPKLFRSANRRTHRKLAIIDKRRAFVGSMNLCAEPVESVFGSKAWRDTVVAISGRAVQRLVESFEETWYGRRERIKRHYSALIRDNRTLVQRLRNHHLLLRELASARNRIYITTAYFIPEHRLSRRLRRAAQRGVDVRIIVPSHSDVFFLPWVSRLFYMNLKQAGIQVLEYQRSMIHSKTMVIDGTAWIGSSNLNSRSLYWDRELDVRVLKPATIGGLVRQFERDQGSALPYEETVLGNFAITRLFGLVLLRLMKLL